MSWWMVSTGFLYIAGASATALLASEVLEWRKWGVRQWVAIALWPLINVLAWLQFATDALTEALHR